MAGLGNGEKSFDWSCLIQFLRRVDTFPAKKRTLYSVYTYKVRKLSTTWRFIVRRAVARGAYALGRHFSEIVTVKPKKMLKIWVMTHEYSNSENFRGSLRSPCFFLFPTFSGKNSAILTLMSLDFLSFSTWREIWLGFWSHYRMSDRCLWVGKGGGEFGEGESIIMR